MCCLFLAQADGSCCVTCINKFTLEAPLSYSLGRRSLRLRCTLNEISCRRHARRHQDGVITKVLFFKMKKGIKALSLMTYIYAFISSNVCDRHISFKYSKHVLVSRTRQT